MRRAASLIYFHRRGVFDEPPARAARGRAARSR